MHWYGGDEHRDVVVAGLELDLELEHAEERGGEPEDEPVGARLELGGQLADAAVAVRVLLGDELVAPVEADGDAFGRAARAPCRGRGWRARRS